jgi:hypothetical protein
LLCLRSFFIDSTGDLDPQSMINTETLHFPFKQGNVSMTHWANSLVSWPSYLPGWQNWYCPVSTIKSEEWNAIGIAHCINLFLVNPSKNESLLLTTCYF